MKSPLISPLCRAAQKSLFADIAFLPAQDDASAEMVIFLEMTDACWRSGASADGKLDAPRCHATHSLLFYDAVDDDDAQQRGIEAVYHTWRVIF